jgi:hypothetical protein
LTDVTEYGDVLVKARVDEWGRRKINGVLEDGTKIIGVSAILKTVTDALGLQDSALRSKTLLPISDAILFADTLLRDKAFSVTDSVAALDTMNGDKNLKVSDVLLLTDLVNVFSAMLKTVADGVSLADVAKALKMLKVSDAVTLSDSMLTPARFLQALDAIDLADAALVSKVLVVTESVSFVEVVKVGVGGVKRTRLFLILGDLAVQLTGD